MMKNSTVLFFCSQCMCMWRSGLVVRALDYHVRGRRFESKFGRVIYGVPTVHPAMMGSCISESQRRPGVVFATSSSCVPWLGKLVCRDCYQPDGRNFDFLT